MAKQRFPPRIREDASDLYAYLGAGEQALQRGLHTIGAEPTPEAAGQYLEAYFGERLSEDEVRAVASCRRCVIG